jgi:hypothetical protein
MRRKRPWLPDWRRKEIIAYCERELERLGPQRADEIAFLKSLDEPDPRFDMDFSPELEKAFDFDMSALDALFDEPAPSAKKWRPKAKRKAARKRLAS